MSTRSAKRTDLERVLGGSEVDRVQEEGEVSSVAREWKGRRLRGLDRERVRLVLLGVRLTRLVRFRRHEEEGKKKRGRERRFERPDRRWELGGERLFVRPARDQGSSDVFCLQGLFVNGNPCSIWS